MTAPSDALAAIGALFLVAGAIVGPWRPPYLLFLYGLSIGFLDVAVPIGSITKVRVDDVLAVLLLVISVLRPSRGPRQSSSQRQFVVMAGLFCLYCLLSLTVVGLQGNAFSLYSAFRMLGCVIMFVALVRVTTDMSCLRTLLAGLASGAVIAGVQGVYHISTAGGPSGFIAYDYLRAVGTPSTVNPAAIPLYGLVYSGLALLGGLLAPPASSQQWLWRGAAAFLMVLPIIYLQRSPTIGVCVAAVVALAALRRWRVLFPVAILVTGILVWSHLAGALVEQATTIDLQTGAGFSGRYRLWGIGLEFLKAHPIGGWGFGREELIYAERGGGMAHNSYLSIAIELGIPGLVLFVAVLATLVWQLWKLRWSTPRPEVPVTAMAYLIGLSVTDLAISSLYWNKTPLHLVAVAYLLLGLLRQGGGYSPAKAGPNRPRSPQQETLV